MRMPSVAGSVARKPPKIVYKHIDNGASKSCSMLFPIPIIAVLKPGSSSSTSVTWSFWSAD